MVLDLIVFEHNEQINEDILIIGKFYIKSQISSFSWHSWRSSSCRSVFSQATISQSWGGRWPLQFPQPHCSVLIFIFFSQNALVIHVYHLAISLLAYEFLIPQWSPTYTKCNLPFATFFLLEHLTESLLLQATQSSVGNPLFYYWKALPLHWGLICLLLSPLFFFLVLSFKAKIYFLPPSYDKPSNTDSYQTMPRNAILLSTLTLNSLCALHFFF